jgi:hypothetical protein
MIERRRRNVNFAADTLRRAASMKESLQKF